MNSVTNMVKLGLVALATGLADWLVAEHWPHLLPYVPWVPLAACPLMHVFMHHGKHEGHLRERSNVA